MVIKKFKICPKCGNWKFGPIICSNCGTNRIESDITTEDYKKLSTEEFEKKITNFIKNSYDENLLTERKEHEKPAFSNYVPSNISKIKCPTCQSTEVQKIGTVDRMVSVGVLGLASNKIGKQFKCEKCGYMW